MIKLKIKLDKIQDIKDFVEEATMLDCDLDLVRDRYIIDAKSIMALFTLDLSKPVDLVIHSDEKAAAAPFQKWVA